MSKQPTLLQEIEQFVYAYAQNMPNRKLLYQIVQKWEEAYQARIEELERVDNSGNRMENEGGPARRQQYDESDFQPQDHFDDDLGGTRYDDFE